MKSSTKRILLILSVSFLLLSLIRFVSDIFRIKEYIYGIILLLTYISSIILLGYTKNRNSNEKNMILAMLVFTLLFQALTFVLLGFKLGFLSSGYKLGFTHLFKIALPMIIILVLEEILRYQFIEKGRYSKAVIIFVTIYMILLDSLIGSSLYNLNTFQNWFEFAASVFFPSIMKNILLTYIAYHYGYKPNLIYRFVMEISMYYLPIVPDIGNYLNSILNIMFPFCLLMYFISYTLAIEFHPKDLEEKQEKNKKLRIATQTMIIIILLISVALMSGMFKYYFLVVGSGSMEPNIKVGDMILVEKTKEYDKLKIGDVLVYKSNDLVIIHRIIDIKKENNEYIFKTKGDNNDTVDAWDVLERDVIGKSNLRFPVIGYPAVWLNEMFKGGN